MPKSPRPPLSRERIARAALALIDEEGLDSCSMRRLGARLGVEAMALYYHFAGKGELYDAVMDCMIEEIVLPARGDVAPLERLRIAVTGWRNQALAHPGAYPLLAARRFNTPRTFGFYEEVLQSFADLGLDAQEAARWFRLIGGFASGTGLAEVASRERVPEATPLKLQRQAEAIPYPHVRAVAPHLRVEALDGVFAYGLDVLFGELERRTRRGKRAPRR